MLGAIIGDIVGSRFEFNNHRSKDFELFAEGCFATDDSIMTLAVARAIMETAREMAKKTVKTPTTPGYDHNFDFHDLLSDMTVKYMQEIGRKYPNCGFGGMFYKWVFSENPEPYNSFGNGAAMRVSPAGFAAKSEWDAEQLADSITAVTHDHDEGIKGAAATTVAIYMAREGALKSEIRDRISRDYYVLDFKIDDIRPTYRFNETCQETVPQAIECFLESTSFEDAIRTAISLGGDSDTIAAITGAIAEAYYGVPDEIKDKALTYLDEELRAIYDEWTAFAPTNCERFKVLTKYIGKLSDRTMIDDYTIPFWDYFPYSEFETDWIYSDFSCANYGQVLADMGVALDFGQITGKSVDDLPAEQVLALITSAFRNDHFDNGVIVKYFRAGAMLKWLKRLKDIDWQRRSRKITEVELQLGGMGSRDTYRVLLTNEHEAIFLRVFTYDDIGTQDDVKEDIETVRSALDGLHFEYWLSSYPQEGEMLICDGEQWELAVTYDDGTVIRSGGDNTYPENWNALLEVFGIEQGDTGNYDDDEDDADDQVGALDGDMDAEQSDNPQATIILLPDYEKLKADVEMLRTELSMLVLERDELLLVECRNIEMAYMLAVGGLEYKAYEIECAILRLKRKAELIQANKNRQEKIVLPKIEELLDFEFAEYKAKLNEKVEKMNAALDRSKGEFLTDEENRELKRLYRTIVKSLHPDLHPDLSDAKIMLFHNAVAAYENGDLNGLRMIGAMVTEPALPEDQLDALPLLVKEKERLYGLLQLTKDKIAEIKSGYPYIMKSLVQSPEKVEARKAELEDDIKQLNELLDVYSAKITEMLR